MFSLWCVCFSSLHAEYMTFSTICLILGDQKLKLWSRLRISTPASYNGLSCSRGSESILTLLWAAEKRWMDGWFMRGNTLTGQYKVTYSYWLSHKGLENTTYWGQDNCQLFPLHYLKTFQWFNSLSLSHISISPQVSCDIRWGQLFYVMLTKSLLCIVHWSSTDIPALQI